MKKLFPRSLILLMAMLISSPSWAFDFLGGRSYFMISETPNAGEFFGLANGNQGFQPLPVGATNAALSALKWLEIKQVPPRPTVKYVREHHYGKWLVPDRARTCLNTRAQVLVRDSRQTVQYSGACTVAAGAWLDPYTNRVYQSAAEIQIDHMVPAKNSYISGAFAWNWQTRCAYFNFMGNRAHLIPVEGRENGVKSDKSPDEYMPPNAAYQCEYLANWLKIKMTWRLMMSVNEARAIAGMVQQLRCDPRLFALTARDLVQQRQLGQQTAAHCPTEPPPLKDLTPDPEG